VGARKVRAFQLIGNLIKINKATLKHLCSFNFAPKFPFLNYDGSVKRNDAMKWCENASIPHTHQDLPAGPG
jgi:hypothetical protein